MNTPWPWRLVAGLLSILVTVPASAFGQVADPKTGFAEAVAQFGLALEGTYGDEGPRVLAGLDALDRGLARWDDTIRSYERAMEAETKNAEPGVAALAHVALGGLYLDRHRLSDAAPRVQHGHPAGPEARRRVHAARRREQSAVPGQRRRGR